MLSWGSIAFQKSSVLGLAGLTSVLMLAHVTPCNSQEKEVESAKPTANAAASEETQPDKKAADEPVTEVKPTEEKAAQDKPAAEKPTDEKPADEKPAEEKPTLPSPGVTFASPESADPGHKVEPAAGELEVQGAIKAFAEAFNAHDAKAVAAFFTEFAELENVVGHITRGNASILEIFTKLFAENPKIAIHLEVHSIRFLSSGLSVEEGTSTMMNGGADGAEVAPRIDRYTMTHFKQDGAWLVASARDLPAPSPTAEQNLQQLAWLVGDWVDENSETAVHTTYHWSKDNRFLLSRYSVQREGQTPVEGMQRIGWDPESRQLHSWTFDSVGGFSQGLWSHSGNRWVVKITGVTGAGQIRSSTNVLTRVSDDHASFSSRDRVVGGELLPDLDAVPIVRKPPEPMRVKQP